MAGQKLKILHKAFVQNKDDIRTKKAYDIFDCVLSI